MKSKGIQSERLVPEEARESKQIQEHGQERAIQSEGDFDDTFTNDKGKEFFESKNAVSVFYPLLLNSGQLLHSAPSNKGAFLMVHE